MAAATQEIARREADIARALEAGEGALADDIADRIVALETDRERARAAEADLADRTRSLRQRLA